MPASRTSAGELTVLALSRAARLEEAGQMAEAASIRREAGQCEQVIVATQAHNAAKAARKADA